MTEQPNEDMGEVLRFPTRGQHQADQVNQADEVEHQADEDVDEHDLVVPDKPATGRPEPLTGEVLPRWQGPIDRRPIVAPWLANRADRRAAARWAAAHLGHRVAFHSVRAPIYGARLAGQSPRGLARAVAAVARWLSDAEARPLRRDMVSGGDVSGYLALVRQRNERIKTRLMVAGTGLGTGAGGGVAVWELAPHGVAYAGMAAVVAALGWAGRRADRPIVDQAVVLSGPAPKLTPDVIVRALGSLGIAEINRALSKGGGGITFAGPITRDGAGWRADVDLPFGVTAVDIIGRRDRVASGLRRPVGCVWPEPSDDAHAGRLVLWVGDQDMGKARPTPWPLARTGRADFFAPVPFGVDPRGRSVAVPLFENNVLIGALPGGGKTATVRVLILAAALDPTCELRVFNLKNNDLDAAERVAHEYGAGLGDDVAEAALGMLRDLRADLVRRAGVLSGLPRSAAPDGKVTRELANRRGLGLHPIVAVIDECQNLFLHPEFGKEAAEHCEYIIKLGRALGVVLILATQRPDKDSLPKGISANVSIRFCLRVTGQVENDMILGTSAYQNGIRATTLRPSDRGIGYLVGAYDEPRVVRSAYIDRDQADKIALRARAVREAAGLLTGYAAGETVERETGPDRSILTDLVQVWPVDRDRVHSDVLVHALADAWPDRYGEWTPATLAAAVRPHQITTRQVWGPCIDGTPSNHQGIHRADLDQADRG